MACGVRGVADELREVEVVHVVDEGGSVDIVEVVKVKVEVPEEYVVAGVYDEWSDEVCDEAAANLILVPVGGK